jgi:hypothetical protein
MKKSRGLKFFLLGFGAGGGDFGIFLSMFSLDSQVPNVFPKMLLIASQFSSQIVWPKQVLPIYNHVGVLKH